MARTKKTTRTKNKTKKSTNFYFVAFTGALTFLLVALLMIIIARMQTTIDKQADVISKYEMQQSYPMNYYPMEE